VRHPPWIPRKADRLNRSRHTVLALALALAAVAVPGAAKAAWSLVWADEFNGTSLNTADWNYDIGTGCPDLCGWGNNELQYYRSQNVAVTGGNLVITAKAESYGGSSFTSGKIHTRGKQSFLYGRMEMRAKLPVGGGMWPAFWMMPQDDAYGGWAASGELDIMESANNIDFIGGALHYGGQWPSNTSTSSSTSMGGASYADDFHIYAVEWEPDEIRWYVDDLHFMTRTSSQWYSDGAPGNPRAPFDQAFYIILNAAVGGNYTGCLDAGCITAQLPQQYLVDYVRVYEDIPNELPTVAITAPNAGAVLPAGDITITATASDADGSISVVEFYNGAALLGQDTTAPYAFTWTSVGNGCYDIVARAIDDLGGTAEAAVDITVGLGCGQLPYLGAPRVLPGVVQAEDYDEGGQGVAYNDNESANQGGQYRTAEGVDIEVCADTGGGFNVGWMVAGEWLEYTVVVPAAGRYTVDARVASLANSGSFRLEFGGVDATGDISFAPTGGWQTWTTASGTMELQAGTQIMRFVAMATDFNLNSFDIRLDALSDVPGAAAAGTVLHPCYPNPFNPSTTIAFELAEPATVTLGIYDVAGRLVRTLAAGEPTGAGRHEATWNGRDAAGQAAPAGVYFYRLDAGGQSLTRRMTLLK
jgi:beta-glucanase (GH16 family)